MFNLGAEKMTEWLRTLAALLEDSGSVTSFSGQSLAILIKTHTKNTNKYIFPQKIKVWKFVWKVQFSLVDRY